MTIILVPKPARKERKEPKPPQRGQFLILLVATILCGLLVGPW